MQLAKLLQPEIEEALRTDPSQLAELAEELHAADLAEVIAELPEESAIKLLAALPAAPAAEAFGFLEMGRRVALLEHLERPHAVRLANEMPPDERADVFAELPEEVRGELLGAMEREEARDVRALLTYPPTSAGGIMTTAYVALSPELPTADAIEQVRRSAEEMETVHDVYAVDPSGVLLGSVSLRDLVLAKKNQTVRDIMDPSTISVDAEIDREEVARLFQRYALATMPVVEPGTRRMLGIVTVDDVVDVLQAEQTEDIHKLAAVEPVEEPYLQSSTLTLIRKRLPWLLVLFVGEMLTSNAVHHYSWVEKAVGSLSIYFALIISAGGNSGSQSAGLAVRALAMGEVKPGDWMRVVRRELAQGLALGAVLGLLGFVRAVAPFPLGMGNDVRIGVTVACALVGVVSLGSTAGGFLPLLFRRLGVDPAVTSAPFIASLVDVLGLVLYFNVAIWVIGLARP